MSWSFHFVGPRAAVRREVAAIKAGSEADQLHIDSVRPNLLALIDANTADALDVFAAGHRSDPFATVTVEVKTVAGFVQ